MNSDILNQSIEFIKGIGPTRSKLLSEELNLKTIKDLIDFYPYRYIDRSRFFKINELPRNQSEVQIIGKIKSIKRTKVSFPYITYSSLVFNDSSTQLNPLYHIIL